MTENKYIKIFEKYRDNLESMMRSPEFEKYLVEFNKSKEIIIIGNGGSNSIASHISQDFVKFHNKKSLSFSDPSMLTCFINDFGMENAYVKFLQKYISKSTLVILISSSGESENILNCIKYLENNNFKYGVLTGFKKDNSARSIATNSLFNFHIDSTDYGVVECLHQIFLHGAI